MISLELERPEDGFKRYTVGKYYCITEKIEEDKIRYRVFSRDENNEYIPQILYDTFNEDPQHPFTINNRGHISCSINDVDKLITEHENYIRGLKIAKSAIKEMQEFFNL